MDFSYINEKSGCASSATDPCESKGQVGAGSGLGGPGGPGLAPSGTPTGETDAPIKSGPIGPGINAGTPIGSTPTGTKELHCISMEVVPANARVLKNSTLAYIVIVKWSDGNTSSHAAGVLFNSSDENVAQFPQHPATPAFDAAGSLGAVVETLKAGKITVTASFATPGNRDNPGRSSSDILVSPCDLSATTELEVMDTTSVTTPELVVLSDFQKEAFASYRKQGGSEPNAVHLYVSPPDTFLEVGYERRLAAIATYSDGSTKDVTFDTFWSSSNTNVATVGSRQTSGSAGTIKGIGGGSAVIGAMYGGIRAEATLDVAILCVNQPVDYVVVLDRSALMLAPDRYGQARVNTARDAARSLFRNRSQKTEDQFSVVSFAGLYINANPPYWPAYTEADATLDLPLTQVTSALVADANRIKIEAVIDNYNVRQPCNYEQGKGSRCASGIGSGLSVARTEINSPRRKTGHKKIVVLMVGSSENIFKPDPQIIAQTMKDEGIVISVIALDVPTYHGTLQNIASPNLFFPSPTIYELSNLFAELPNIVCRGNYGYYFYPYY